MSESIEFKPLTDSQMDNILSDFRINSESNEEKLLKMEENSIREYQETINRG